MGAFMALAAKFDFGKYRTLCDVGGAGAALSIVLGSKFPNLTLTSFDLPPVAPIAKRNVSAAGLGERVSIASGDFFQDPLPKAEVITLGNILHDWSLAQKLALLKSAYDALPSGGVLIAVENIIDDERRKNAFGLLMSVMSRGLRTRKVPLSTSTRPGPRKAGSSTSRWARRVATGFS